MNTLIQPPVAPLLDSLFAAAARADAPLFQSFSALAPAERAARMATANTDYRGFYARVREAYLPVSRELGSFLYALARARRARAIVEFGTSFGLSTIHLAAALRDNGGGRLIGSEFEENKALAAEANLRAAGLADLVEVRRGDALESFAKDLPESIDLLLLDGAKVLYPKILALLEPRLAAGALVVADNAKDSPEFVARMQDPQRGYATTMLSVAEDALLAVRVPR